MQAVVERPNVKSGQLIHLYQGFQNGLMMEPLQFISGAKILDRHLIMFRDPHNRFYHGEICELFPDIETNIEWQKNNIKQHDHVNKLYCTGTSAGAYAAILFGHYLEADAVYAFGANTEVDMDWWVRQEEAPVIPEQHQNLSKLLENWNGKTKYHLYYSVGHDFDREQAQRLKDCPGVVLHAIPGTSHNIFESKEGKALLPKIFPTYKSTRPSRK